jgi:hypothetical protein
VNILWNFALPVLIKKWIRFSFSKVKKMKIFWYYVFNNFRDPTNRFWDPKDQCLQPKDGLSYGWVFLKILGFGWVWIGFFEKTRVSGWVSVRLKTLQKIFSLIRLLVCIKKGKINSKDLSKIVTHHHCKI